VTKVQGDLLGKPMLLEDALALPGRTPSPLVAA
jgi:hypothetical protein